MRYPLVVVDQVALGEAGLRVEDLVEVRERDRRLLHLLGHHLLGLLVEAQALERGVAEHPLRRPLGELELGNQFGLDEDRALWRLDRAAERARLALERLEPLGEVAEGGLCEARPDLAGVAQLAALV